MGNEKRNEAKLAKEEKALLQAQEKNRVLAEQLEQKKTKQLQEQQAKLKAKQNAEHNKQQLNIERKKATEIKREIQAKDRQAEKLERDLDTAVQKRQADQQSVAKAEAKVEELVQQLEEMTYVKPSAGKAKIKRHHVILAATLLFFVLIPISAVGIYLWGFANDQYSSTVGFAVRNDEQVDNTGLLGNLTSIASPTTSDSDILYEFIKSQTIVKAISKRVDLAAVWSKPENDPYFSFDAEGATIEDLVEHWRNKVYINYEGSTGLIEVEVRAFDPNDAFDISTAIFQESSDMINRLNFAAREDAVSSASSELAKMEDRLRKARSELTLMRERNNITDPTLNIQSDLGVINSLQQQLVESLISLGILQENTNAQDQRIEQATKKIKIIREQIKQERKKFSGQSNLNEADYSKLVGDFEALQVEREFAEAGFLAARTNYDAAVAKTQRQSKYLASYIQPTLAERALYPQRLSTLGVFAFLIFMAWMLGALIFYSIKDRR